MNVIFALAGNSIRFAAKGYKNPKFFLDLDDKTIIEAMINLFDDDDKFLFVINQEQSKKYKNKFDKIKKLKKNINFEIIKKNKKGPAYSCLNLKNINYLDKCIISYCDFLINWDYKKFKRDIYSFDGAIVNFKGFHPSSFTGTLYAYSKIKQNKIIKIREKNSFTSKPFNEFASAGIYYFKSYKLFNEYSKKLIKKNKKKENYVSEVYNDLIKDNFKILNFECKNFISLGTPKDYEIYKYWISYFKNKDKYQNYSKLVLNNSIIPMAGLGQRMKNYGYSTIKPLILIGKDPILKYSINSLPKSKKNYLVMRNHTFKKYPSLKKISLENKINIIKLKKPTLGQADTCYKVAKYLNPNEEVFINSCDYELKYNEKKFYNLKKKSDVIIFVSKLKTKIVNKFNNYGYCKVSKNSLITKITEKKILSKSPDNDYVVVGSFWFKKIRDLLYISEISKKKSFFVNNEIFLANSINLLLNKKKCRIFLVDYWNNFGDPFDINIFNYWKDYFNK